MQRLYTLTLIGVLVPPFNGQFFDSVFAEGKDKRTGDTGIGNQRNAVINRTPANGVSVADLAGRMIFWNVDYQVDFLIFYQFQCIGVFIGFIRPVNPGGINSIVIQELLCSTGCKQVKSAFRK